jgi:hypothetical protein
MKHFISLFFLFLYNVVYAQNIVPYLTKNNKYIFVDSETLVQAFNGEYDSTDGFIGSFAIVEVSNKYGFINKKGNTLLPIEYNEKEIGYALIDKNYVLISELKNNLHSVRCFQVNDFKEIFTFSGEEIKQNQLEFKPIENYLLIYSRKSENIYGLYSLNTGWKIPFYSNKFEKTEIFKTIENEKYSNQIIAVKKNNKWGILNLDNLEENAIYDEIKPIDKNLIKVKKDELWAVADKNQNLLTDFIFSDIEIFRAGSDRCAVKISDKWGFIDSKAKLIVPVIYDEYDEINGFENGLVAVAKKSKINGFENNKVLKNFLEELKWGVIDEFNNVKIDFLYNSAPQLEKNEFVIVNKVIDGELEIDLNYYSKTGKIIKKKKAKPIILFKNGKEKILLNKYSIDPNFQNKLPLIKISDKKTWKHGLINVNQDLIVSPIYDEISEIFKDKLYSVFNGKFGLINNKGAMILPLIYDEIETMYNVVNNTYDYLKLKKGDKYLIADKNGKFITREKYDKVSYIKDYFVVVNQNKMGLINKKGEILLPLEFDKISIVGPYIEIFKNKKYGLIDSNFQKILDLKYNMIAYSDLSVSYLGNITSVFGINGDRLPTIKAFDGMEMKIIDLNKEMNKNLIMQNRVYVTSNDVRLPFYSFGSFESKGNKLFQEQ